MRLALVPAVLVAALAGCTPPGFSRLGDFSMEFMGGGSPAFVELSYDIQAAGGCQTLPSDFSANVNGLRADTSVGGPGQPLFLSATCLFPTIVFPVPRVLGQTLTLQATSQGETIEVEMEGVGLSLSGTPLLAPGQQVHAGDQVQIQLGAGFERVTWPQQGIATAGDVADTFEVTAPSPAGVLQVQLPSTLPAGFTRIQVQTFVNPEVTRCSGPVNCHWIGGFSMMPGLDVALMVAP